jgi:GNAT superfamily N-acetyltransferase
MNLSFKEDYWDHPESKTEFIRFLARVFGLDLSLWDLLGYWDNNYRPFSFFDQDTLVSNVCVYSMDLTVNGKPCRAAQISAVGTLPEYRRKGLSMELTQKAVAWARDNHDFFYLFADRDANPFYAKCGFRSVDEYKARIPAPEVSERSGVLKMDMEREDHRDLMFRLASNREPVSDILGVSNRKLLMFWCLYSLRDCVHYLPELDVAVLYKRENGLVTMCDIVGSPIPSFSQINPFICQDTDHTVEFRFMTDKMNVSDPDLIRFSDNGTHLFGDFPLDGTRFLFPLTAQA